MVRSIAVLLSCLALSAGAIAGDVVIRIGDDVEVTQTVEGSLAAAAGRITVDAPVEGDASLAGGKIIVKGAVRDHLRVAGGHVIIDGPVGRHVSVAAGTLELGPDARIDGRLTFHGGELKRDPAAVVTGAVEHSRARSRSHHPIGRSSSGFLGWVWTTGLLLLAALIAAALPGPSQRMAQELRERPWVTTLVGLVALTTIPVAAALLMITIIGIPIGLLAVVGYAALLLVGYVWLAVAVGGLLLDRVKPETAAPTAWRAGAAALAMLILALLTRLPFIGGLVVFAALVVGVGMVVAVILRKTGAVAAPAV